MFGRHERFEETVQVVDGVLAGGEHPEQAHGLGHVAGETDALGGGGLRYRGEHVRRKARVDFQQVVAGRLLRSHALRGLLGLPGAAAAERRPGEDQGRPQRFVAGHGVAERQVGRVAQHSPGPGDAVRHPEEEHVVAVARHVQALSGYVRMHLGQTGNDVAAGEIDPLRVLARRSRREPAIAHQQRHAAKRAVAHGEHLRVLDHDVGVRTLRA